MAGSFIIFAPLIVTIPAPIILPVLLALAVLS